MKNKFKTSTYIFLLGTWLFGKKKIQLGAPNFGCSGTILTRKWYTFKHFLSAAKMHMVHELEGENFDKLTKKQIYEHKL